RLKSYCHTAGNLNRIKIGMGFSGRLHKNSLSSHAQAVLVIFYVSRSIIDHCSTVLISLIK
ncbi:hypothetical protein ACRCKW_15650, partial [Acinetobacter baumannii]|uniref:hypothetical protein n=1 Tax=Acinetobacter baumannii TaxID=470 RepID=UPI003D6BA12F